MRLRGEDAAEGMHGVRIFDVSNPRTPKLVKNVRPQRVAHAYRHSITHRPWCVYIYVSGSGGARDSMPGCVEGTDPADETIRSIVSILSSTPRQPAQAEVVTGARIFTGIGPGRVVATRRLPPPTRRSSFVRATVTT